jgi:putative DNA primase/helicase
MKKDYVASVTEQLIEQLEAGTAPWVKPWSAGARFMPFNPITGKDYRGMNAITLLMTAEAFGYGDARWMTYRQAASQDAQVRRGEKSTIIQYWKWRDERPVTGADGKPLRDADGKTIIEVVDLVRPRVFAAAVFNAAQIDGLPEPEPRPALPEWRRHEVAEAILHNSGADIRHLACDRAAYNRILDAILLPERAQFPTADGYYATALHELGHWTGHETRLNRDLAHPFGSEGYAREELRAEIASLMLGDRLGLGHDPSQHAAYVGHFLQILRNDPQEIFRAASDAEKIVSFLQRFQQTQTADQTVMAERVIALPASVSPQQSSARAEAAERMFLAVPFAEKDQAKTLGAKWDRRARAWYVPAGIDPEPFLRWRRGRSRARCRKIRAPNSPRRCRRRASFSAGCRSWMASCAVWPSRATGKAGVAAPMSAISTPIPPDSWRISALVLGRIGSRKCRVRRSVPQTVQGCSPRQPKAGGGARKSGRPSPAKPRAWSRRISLACRPSPPRTTPISSGRAWARMASI